MDVSTPCTSPNLTLNTDKVDMGGLEQISRIYHQKIDKIDRIPLTECVPTNIEQHPLT